MAFGETTKKFRYAVIVCPRCKQHAQITETGKKTLRCQRCGALLQALKLRVFYSCEELPEAVDFRARLQAEISGKGYETFSLEAPAKEPEISNPEGKDTARDVRVYELENKPPRNSPSKKDQKLIFIEIIGTAGGKIEINELKKKALDRGIGPEKFEIMLKKLLETGEIYSPEPGMIKKI